MKDGTYPADQAENQLRKIEEYYKEGWGRLAEAVRNEPHGARDYIIPPALLAELRRLDATIGAAITRREALLEGFLIGDHIELAENGVNFDLDTGHYTVTPLGVTPDGD